MLNKNIIRFGILLIFIISGCSAINTSQNIDTRFIPSDCKSYGKIVYDSNGAINTKEEAETLFWKFKGELGIIDEMILFTGKTSGIQIDGWVPSPYGQLRISEYGATLDRFFIGKNGKIYSFIGCE